MCRWPKNARYLQPERLGPKMEVWSYGLAESQKERERESKYWGRESELHNSSTWFITYTAKPCSQSYYECSVISVRHSRGVIDAAL